MTDDWGRPVETTGEFATPQKLQGHLLVLYPIGYVPHIQTKFSRPDKRSDAVCVDVVDLDDKDEATGLPGKIYRNCNFMQGHLIAALRPMIGSRILGVISLGVSKAGMNAPWIVVDMLDNQAAKERAVAWGQANPGFKPSTFVLRVENPVAPVSQLAPPAPGYQQPTSPYVPPQPQYQQPGQYTQQPAYPPNPQPAQQPLQAPAQAPPPQYMAPVQGSPQVSQEEMTMLQRMRLEAQARQQEIQQQFGDNPPF